MHGRGFIELGVIGDIIHDICCLVWDVFLDSCLKRGCVGAELQECYGIFKVSRW